MFFMYWSWFKWLWRRYNVMNYVRNNDLLDSDGDDELIGLLLNVNTKCNIYYYGIIGVLFYSF